MDGKFVDRLNQQKMVERLGRCIWEEVRSVDSRN